VKEFNQELIDLTNEMFLVMYASEGVGLAAPQVGVNKRVMVFNSDPPAKASEFVLVNPKIVKASTRREVDVEGCLSFPDVEVEIVRRKWVRVEYQNLLGQNCTRTFTNLEARIFQHEFDHLQQTLLIDRMLPQEKEITQRHMDALASSSSSSSSSHSLPSENARNHV